MPRRITVPHGLQIRHIQILHSRVLAILCEIRLALSVGIAKLRKICDVSCQSGCESRDSLSVSKCRGFFENQSRANAVPCGLERCQVTESLILVGVVQVEGVSSEHHFADQSGKPFELVGVPTCLAAIKDWRVKHICDVVENFLFDVRKIVRDMFLNVATIHGGKVNIGRAL